MAERILDCKGMNCPMPIVQIAKAFRAMEVGDRLIVEADDPSFGADVKAWIRRMGHELSSFESEGHRQRATLAKTAGGR